MKVGFHNAGPSWKDRARAELPYIKRDACIGAGMGIASVIVSLVAGGVFHLVGYYASMLERNAITWNRAVRVTCDATTAFVTFGIIMAVIVGMKKRKTL